MVLPPEFHVQLPGLHFYRNMCKLKLIISPKFLACFLIFCPHPFGSLQKAQSVLVLSDSFFLTATSNLSANSILAFTISVQDMSSPLDDNNSCNWPLPTSASWPCSGFSLLINVNLILPHPYNTYNDFVFSVTPDLLSRAVVLSPNLPAAFSSLFLATFHYLVLSIPTCVKLSANSGTQKLCPYVFYSLVLMLPVTSSMKAFWKTSSKINFL